MARLQQILISACLCLCYGAMAMTASGRGYVHYHHDMTECETIAAPPCNRDDSYASFDGRCNNLKHPTWGAGGTRIRRMLPPEYDDGVRSPRHTGKFRALPLPRVLSNRLKETNAPSSTGVSHLHVLFGQLLAHDIVHTPIAKTLTGAKVECDCRFPSNECVNIKFPIDDPQRVIGGKDCIELTRSKAAVGYNSCTFNFREQVTTMSSYIDGTFLYGKSEQEVNDLRDPSSNAGELFLVRSPHGGPGKILPKQSDMPRKRITSTMDCKRPVLTPANETCFVSGDVRVGENIGLVAIQTAFARYHNWVGRELKLRNPHWNNDKVFFEARRVVSAVIQTITYREYLPILLGPKFMKRFGLTVPDEAYWNGYDSRYDASIANEFSTAAFRYGHSQVAEIVHRATSFFDVSKVAPISTKKSFFNNKPFSERGGGSGAILRGFMTDTARRTDSSFAEGLRNHLFAPRGKPYGGDLFAMNIQRGRDHGIAGYNKYRDFCGFKRAETFDDLRDDISESNLRRLRSLYHNVDDIDLYVGGLSETHVEGGIVGKTFACILSYTMRGLRRGDRLWHELGNSNNPFTLEQLQSIRKVGLASVLCQTGEDMRYIVENPFKMQGQRPGAIMSCGNVAKLDLSPWNILSTRTGSMYHQGVEWTPWFATGQRALIMNPKTFFAEIKITRPDHVCDNFVSWQLRYVRNDVFVQVRFSCEFGTIAATDFPFQASDKTEWTEWIERQNVDRSEFSCGKIIALQAKTVYGDTFALETGDVFERFGTTGFTCRDRHQLNGACRRYKVRALCTRSIGISATVAPTTSTPAFPQHVLKNTAILCGNYKICCGRDDKFRRWIVPRELLQVARSYCNTYNLCCDV